MGGASVKAPPNSHNFVPRLLTARSCSWIEAWLLLWGLPKWFKVMVAYLKASGNEKTYLDYVWVAWEAEKKEVMEPSCNLPMVSANKPQVMNFFPLWKLKGSQPTTTPSAQVAHLEEESIDKEECIDSKDPDGIEGITEDFIVCLARAVKDAWQEKHCYHCNSPDHFIHDCLLVAASRTDFHLNQKEGMALKKRAWAPQGKVTQPKVPQDGTPKHKMLNTDALLESWPFNWWYGIKNIARVRVSGERCMALLANGT